ncbi:hemolysin family protein [Synechococcus elongatus]|uniref:Hemolysin family protein n=1 Tax=Synechococcus elongatus PCC 11802 TaxID=2283154 RepID=A0AAT9JYV2_SYNEL|nr:hemolysin family protein [Synechococcus elongatus]QFZ91534.1 HlyC/CorC family transporter [Synechococcus elongatus PCC 11802]
MDPLPASALTVAIAASPDLPLSAWLWRGATIALLIAINAFFVTAEFAIVYVRRSRINQLAQEGDVPARMVERLQRSIDRLLSTTQLGITLASLALGWVGESTIAILIRQALDQLPLPAIGPEPLSHVLAIPLAFALLVYLQIVLGELCPKAVALIYPEQMARLLGPPSIAIAQIFAPVISLLNGSTRCLLGIFGIDYSQQRWYSSVTPEELQWIIRSAAESTGLEAEERQILSNVIEFGEITASEVMVPRTRIVALEEEATFHDLLAAIQNSGHACFPLIGDSLDQVLGLIDFRALAVPMASGELKPSSPIKAWVQPVRFVPENLSLKELLPQMQRSPLPMAIVVDEFGGTEGLVTLQDILAEILGDEEQDGVDNEQFRRIDEQTVLVQAQTDLETVNERLGLDLPLEEEYNTLGGFVVAQLQKIPEAGEGFDYQDCQIRVAIAEGPRLEFIEIRQLRSPEPTASDEAKPHANI